MSELLRVRDAAEADAAAVARLCAEWGHPVSEEHVEERIHVHGAEATAGALVAERAGVIVGFISYDSICDFASAGRKCFVTALAVTGSTRRSGVGRALMAGVERRARQAGCTVLALTSGRREERDAAHRFYPALGFVDACSHQALYKKDLTWLGGCL